MKKTYLLVIATFFILIGCGSSKKTPQPYLVQEKLPSWYLSTKSDDGESLYSTGEGKDKQEAIASALSNLISTFQVTVESSFSSKKELDSFVSNNVYRKIDKQTKLKTNATKITNYKVINVHEESFDKILVQIKVNKTKLAIDTKKSIDKHIKNANQSIHLVSNDGFLERYKNYKRLYNLNPQIENKLKLLDYLSFPYSESYENFLSQIENEYKIYKKNLVVKIKYDRNSKIFKTSMQSYLISKGISFEGDNSQSDLLLQLDTKKSNAKAMGLDLVVYSTTLSLVSKNKTANNLSIVLKEVNKGDINLVQKNANLHFLRQLEDKKAFKEDFDF